MSLIGLLTARLKTSGFGTVAHEANSMAFKETLACPRSLGKDYSPAKVCPCPSEVVVGLFIYLGFYVTFNTVQVIS